MGGRERRRRRRKQDEAWSFYIKLFILFLRRGIQENPLPFFLFLELYRIPSSFSAPNPACMMALGRLEMNTRGEGDSRCCTHPAPKIILEAPATFPQNEVWERDGRGVGVEGEVPFFAFRSSFCPNIAASFPPNQNKLTSPPFSPVFSPLPSIDNCMIGYLFVLSPLSPGRRCTG